MLGDPVGAAPFALDDPIRANRGHRAGLKCGESGETSGGEERGVDAGEYIAQGSLARSLEPAGKGVEGAAQPGQDILVAAAYPLGNGGQGVVSGAGEGTHADREQRGQPEPHPTQIPRIWHLGQCVEQPGRHHRLGP